MLHNNCYNPDVSYALARDAALHVLTDSCIKDAVFLVGGACALDGLRVQFATIARRCRLFCSD